MKNLTIYSSYHPFSRYTEDCLAILDFINSFANVKFSWENINRNKYPIESNILFCLEDDTDLNFLYRKVQETLKLNNYVFLFFPTRTKNFSSKELKVLKDFSNLKLESDSFFILTNDILSFSKEQVFYKSFVKEQINVQDKSFDLAFFDLFSDSIESSTIFHEEIRPYLSGEKNRKNSLPLIIYSNIGISSINSSKEVLTENNILIKGCDFYHNTLEHSLPHVRNFYMPTSYKRNFNRWCYLVEKCYGGNVFTDHLHGYQSFHQNLNSKNLFSQINFQ